MKLSVTNQTSLGKGRSGRSSTFKCEQEELLVTVVMDVATAAALRKEVDGSPMGEDGTWIYSRGPVRP